MRTVVNKLDVIQNKFRVFDMELLAGEPDYLVEHVSSGLYTLLRVVLLIDTITVRVWMQI